MAIKIEDYIRNIPDFPKKGIQFKDITPLLANPEALKACLEQMTEPFRDLGITHVVAVEARGFLFGPHIAAELGIGFIPVRKPGKLPYETHEISYELEYGTDTLQIHKDALTPGAKVLILDDLLATGGTVNAVCQLVEKFDASVVAAGFMIELEFLQGHKLLTPHIPNIVSLIKY
jgi:adenine phosphoribosyltransferase